MGGEREKRGEWGDKEGEERRGNERRGGEIISLKSKPAYQYWLIHRVL